MLGRLKERLSPERTMKRQEKRQRRAMQFEMLERRILPSAGGVIASHVAKQMTDMVAAPPAHVRWDSRVVQHTNTQVGPGIYGEAASPSAVCRYHLNVAEAQQAWAAKQAAPPASNAAAAPFTSARANTTAPAQAGAQLTAFSQKPVQEIVFVDPSVTDYTQLVQDIVRGNANGAGQGRGAITSTGTGAIDDNGTLIVVLNPNKDGIDQITQVLSQYQDVAAVYILSHGSAGLVTLGTTDLTEETLQSRLAEVSGWQASLAPGADILLYACDVAGSPAGVRFVNDLAAATGTVVAASMDNLGGGANDAWTLGYSTGVITAAPLFSATAVAGYDYLLADYVATTHNETLTGTSGNDRFIFSNNWGNDTVTDTGTSGVNTLDFSNVTANLTFTFHADGTVSVTDPSGDTLNNVANIQEIIGGSGNNTYKFDNGATFAGIIDGGVGGTNTLDYSAYKTAVTVNLGAGTATGTQGVSNITGIVGSSTANTTLAFSDGWSAYTIDTTGIKTLDFSAVTSALTFIIGADGTVSLTDGQNTISEIKGVGAIIGGSGNNTYAFDNGAAFAGTIDGGVGGTNTLNYSAYTTAVTVNLAAGTATGTTGISNIQNITGGSGNDTLTGNSGNNVIIAGSGNDTITGGGGSDTLVGGSGSDTFKFSNAWGTDSITDSSGTNTLDFSAVTSSLTFTIGTSGVVSVSDGAGNSISNVAGIEGLIGGSGNNTFVFNNGAVLAGTINGGVGGTNTLDYSAYTTAVQVDFTTGTATGTAGFSDIDVVKGGQLSNDYVFGDTTSADDAWGSLTISGGASNTLDFSKISSDTDLAFTIHADGTVLVGDNSTDTLAGPTSGVANVAVIYGGAGDDTYAFDDQGAFTGTISGGSGTSTLDYTAYTTGVKVNLSGSAYTTDADEATNASVTVAAGSATGTGGITNIQNITGGQGNDILIGSSGNNTIIAGGGTSIVDGLGGTDTLVGSGSDTFEFQNGWGTGTTVLSDSAAGTSVLDFSGVTENLWVAINLDDTVSVANANPAGTTSPTDTLTEASNIQGIVGGSGSNDFVFADQATFDGTLNGGVGGTNTLDYSAYTSAVEVNISPSVAIATGTQGVSDFQNVTGGQSDNALIGNGVSSILQVAANNEGDNIFADAGVGGTIIGSKGAQATNTVEETWNANTITLTDNSLTVTNGSGPTLSTLESETLENIAAADLTGGASTTVIDASNFTGTATLDGGSSVPLSALNSGGLATTDATSPDLTGSTPLSTLNDGSGVRILGNGTDDFQITLTDRATFDVSLTGANTLQDAFNDITNAATAANLSGRITASIDTQEGNSIVLTDSADAGGSVTVRPLNGSYAASDLGLYQAGTTLGNGSTLIGTPIAEVTADIQVTMMSGAKVDIDLSNLDTVQDVLSAINDANPNLVATINSTGTGINLTDTAGGSGSLSVVNMNGSLAGADLGLTAGTWNSSTLTLSGTTIVSGPVTLDGRYNDATLIGGAGATTFAASGGSETIEGNASANNTLVVTRGDDTYNFKLSGTPASSTLTIDDLTANLSSTDTLSNINQVTITAGNGNNDVLDTSKFSGSVTLDAGDGNSDVLKGGSGTNILYAGNGSTDQLWGGTGTNTLTVGTGAGDQINGMPGAASNTLLEVGDSRFVLTDTTLDMGQGTDEVQQVTLDPKAAGGTFTLTYDGQTTIAIPYDATAGAIQADLVTLSNIGSDSVSVTGNPGAWEVTFTGNLAGEPIGTGPTGLSADGSGLIDATGSFLATSSVTVAVVTPGKHQTLDAISNINNAEIYGVGAGVLIDASGFSGTATLSGGEGDNTIIAGSGPTTVIGGSGDNTFVAGTGKDTITGGGGTNTLLETQDGSMTLTNGALSLNGSPKDTFTNIQNVVLTDSGSGKDTLDASAFDGASTGTALQSLNGGNGIYGTPSLAITLTNGDQVSVDLNGATTIQDVLNAIDASSGYLTASLNTTTSAISITDSSAGSGSLIVANGAGSAAAADLGIAGTGTSTGTGGVLIGSSIYAASNVSTTTTLQSLNNESGLGTSPSLAITLTNGTQVSVDLSSATTIQDMLNAIDASSGYLQATVNTTTSAISITDSSAGSGSLTIVNGAGSAAATDLGIATTGTGGILNGSSIYAASNASTTTTLQSLNNESGLGTSPSLAITLTNGTQVSVDLSSATTIQDVLNDIDLVTISSAGGSGTINPLTAVLNTLTGAISITDSSGGSGSLIVANGAASAAATDLGIAGTSATGVLTGTPIVAGNVTLVAGKGNDTLEGSLGNNTFVGGSGDDTMTGQADAWSNTLVETQDADMTLSDSGLALNGVSKDTFTNIGNAILTNSGHDAHTLDASAFSGSVTLVSGGERILSLDRRAQASITSTSRA